MVISESLMGAGQSRVRMHKAAEELEKTMKEAEAPTATGSGAAGGGKADDTAAHRQQLRDLKMFGQHDVVGAVLVAQFQYVQHENHVGCGQAPLE